VPARRRDVCVDGAVHECCRVAGDAFFAAHPEQGRVNVHVDEEALLFFHGP